jgi:peptidyl-dipeptidase Dcp
MSNTPILDFSVHPHAAPQFDKIQVVDYEPALQTSLQLARDRIAKLKANTAPPDFANVIEALETAGDELDSVGSVFYNQLSAHTSPDLQALAPKVAEAMAAFSSDISLDPVLFNKVKSVYHEHFESGRTSSLSGEQKQLLRKSYLSFVRNGALLTPEQKEKVRAIDQELAKLSPQFNDNVLKVMNTFHLHLTKPEEVAGLPASALEAAQAAAKERNVDGYVFTLHGPSYVPFLTYAERRDLREKMWRAYGTRACGGDSDNRPLVRRTAELRAERAKLLGYATHADFVLQERMAKSANTVTRFLEKLREAYRPYAMKDIAAVAQLAKEHDNIQEIMPWDVTYYSEKLKQKLFEFDEEELRPYFSLENVVQGVFLHAEKLYGLKFKKVNSYPTYHPDVQVFEVSDSKGFVGLFYADFFPRESKRGGAWMTTYREQGLWQGEVRRPLVSIVCNFTKPVGNKPSLLTLDEVCTLFHEFGHALHGLLSQCHYRSVGGTNVFWDFVELPSQVMENWVFEKESLDLFASHFETGEKIPHELIDKIRRSKTFFAGYGGLRQVSLGLLDMAWATLTAPVASDEAVLTVEEKAMAPASVLPKIPGTSISTSFSHVFAGRYSAGYYSYKWAEVLDADAFEFFKEKGLFSTDVATRFRDEVLSRGGSDHPAELYRRFRGRDADPDALLRRDGLV